MRVQSLEVKNFRAIRYLNIRNLSDAIVVAGSNGCGKSTIFDALRLLKSAYGQYVPGEYQRFFSDFEVNVNNLQEDAEKFLNDPARPLEIHADFEVSEEEIEFLKINAQGIFRKLRWNVLLRRKQMDGDYQIVDPSLKKGDGEIVDAQAAELATTLFEHLGKPLHRGSLTMQPGRPPQVVGSPVLELLFSVYEPGVLGIMDYQAPTRIFPRDNLSNINLRIKDANNQRAQRALNNDQNKYTGVKTEMAQSYVTEIISEKAGVALPKETTLKSTLDELFANFFPGKKFLGAIPTKDGGLKFPIVLENGREHDINELSSGEKEVLLGYLRLRNSAPRNSIILLDEPELHLNPRLARGLPRFYEKHLGSALNNQIWMVTHSDAILREAVNEPAYDVFHMQPGVSASFDTNQVDHVEVGAEIENAVISLSGDLASYNPRSKIVMVEGEGAEFDARVISQLFPEFVERVNMISLGSKGNVSQAHGILEQASQDGKLDARFFSITDRDFFPHGLDVSDRAFVWDVYHIENYLLHADFIREALLALTAGVIDKSVLEIDDMLRSSARETMDEIVRIQLTEDIFGRLKRSISLKFDRGKKSTSDGLSDCITASADRFRQTAEQEVNPKYIAARISELHEVLENSLRDNTWKAEFRGRDVLKRFVSKLGGMAKYEQLRNLILSRMKEAGYRPQGMENIIEEILAM